MNKNQELLKDFTKYAKAHPDERFYQALRNWMEVDQLCVLEAFENIQTGIVDEMNYVDTFYWTTKSHYDYEPEED